MGGIGSGARRSTRLGNVEDMLGVDIRALRRLGVLQPGECVIDTVNWSIRGLQVARARLRADLSDIERGGTVTITGAMPDGAMKQHIAIDAAPAAFGGHRCYFVCPITAERCEVLYYAGGRFASRHAHRLSYATQNMNDLSRARRKIAKLRSRLEGDDGIPRARGRNRIDIVRRLERVTADAHALHFDRLRTRVERYAPRR